MFAPGIRDYAARVMVRTPVLRLEWTDSALFAEIGDQRPVWRVTEGGRWTRSCSCGYKDDRCVHLYLVAKLFFAAARAESWELPAGRRFEVPPPAAYDAEGKRQKAEGGCVLAEGRSEAGIAGNADSAKAGAEAPRTVGTRIQNTERRTPNGETKTPDAEGRRLPVEVRRQKAEGKSERAEGGREPAIAGGAESATRPQEPAVRSVVESRPVISFAGADLFQQAEAVVPQSQRLEAEADFHHDSEATTLRFYLVTDGRRELLRMQDLYNLSYRARSGRPDPAMDRFPAEDIRLLRFLGSSLQDLYKSNLQVMKVPRERFSTWLGEWISCPARFIERNSQQPVNACGGRSSALHFELRDAPEGQVDIAAVVTVPGGKNYLLHEIFQLLAGGSGRLVLDGKLLDFEPPVPWKHLNEFFSRKTPRAARRLIPELLPVVTAGRLDLVRGAKVRQRLVTAAPSVEVKPDGAALLLRAKLGQTTVFPGSETAAGGIRSDGGGGWLIESYGSPHLDAVRRLLRVEGAEKQENGWCRIPGDPRAVTAFLAAWDMLPPGGAVKRHIAPELDGLLGARRALVPELRMQESRGFVDMHVSWTGGDAASSVSHHDLCDAVRAGGSVLRTRSGGWFRFDGAAAGRLAAEMDEWGLDDAGHCRMFAPEAGKALERARAKQLPVCLHPAAQPLVERLRRGSPLTRLMAPSELAPVLRDYQRHGFEFLADRAAWNVGAILADDMGLGKTLQVLALLQAFADAAAGGTEERNNGRTEKTTWPQNEPNTGRTEASAVSRPEETAGGRPEERKVLRPASRGALVVCPASVVGVWMEQAARFCPRLKCVAYAGQPEKRAALLAAGGFDVLVTNYSLVRNDIAALAEEEWSFVVLDEAQQIKNPDSQIAQAVGRLRTPRPVALTGTPLENRLLDLWSIMNFVNPGFLGSRDLFLARYEAGGWQKRGLSRAVAPVILRRLKETVASELPPRTEEVLRVEFTDSQRKLYDQVLASARASAKEKGTLAVLAALTRLRQTCCDPRLLPAAKLEGQTEEDAAARAAAQVPSAKLDCLLDLAQELMDEGHSMLVFSQFTQMLDLIQAAMAAAGIPTLMLTGDTPVPERARLVEEFNRRAEPCVFLLSLKAAGTGLTLTKADYVVIYDPWWNPAVERQAIDRTHRIGQTKPVIAYRLVAAGTVEEKILQMQQEKAELFAAVMADTERGGELPPRLTADDLARLLE